MRKSNDTLVWLALGASAVVLHTLAYMGRTKLTQTEVLGFVTGAACVWLTVRQNIWLWPVSIANNMFFIVLFYRSRLYADMSLQFVYIVLEVLGWYWWLHGGKDRRQLHVSKTTARHALVVGMVGLAALGGMVPLLYYVEDSAPFLDGLTTVLSLVAQYMLTRKLLENWYVWITADVIYIGLYISRGLHLTALLYLLFMAMCVAGLREWRRSMQESGRGKQCATATA